MVGAPAGDAVLDGDLVDVGHDGGDAAGDDARGTAAGGEVGQVEGAGCFLVDAEDESDGWSVVEFLSPVSVLLSECLLNIDLTLSGLSVPRPASLLNPICGPHQRCSRQDPPVCMSDGDHPANPGP